MKKEEVISKEEHRRVLEATRALQVMKKNVCDLRSMGIRFLEVNKLERDCESEAEKRYSGCSPEINDERRAFLAGALFGSNNE